MISIDPLLKSNTGDKNGNWDGFKVAVSLNSNGTGGGGEGNGGGGDGDGIGDFPTAALIAPKTFNRLPPTTYGFRSEIWSAP